LKGGDVESQAVSSIHADSSTHDGGLRAVSVDAGPPLNGCDPLQYVVTFDIGGP
jgi:hypothetical protein